jgi:hypothetical protein
MHGLAAYEMWAAKPGAAKVSLEMWNRIHNIIQHRLEVRLTVKEYRSCLTVLCLYSLVYRPHKKRLCLSIYLAHSFSPHTHTHTPLFFIYLRLHQHKTPPLPFTTTHHHPVSIFNNRGSPLLCEGLCTVTQAKLLERTTLNFGTQLWVWSRSQSSTRGLRREGQERAGRASEYLIDRWENGSSEKMDKELLISINDCVLDFFHDAQILFFIKAEIFFRSCFL